MWLLPGRRFQYVRQAIPIYSIEIWLNKERNGVTEETGQITSVHGESPFPRPQLRMVFTALPYSVLKETGSNAEK